jgi:hypothetical protein
MWGRALEVDRGDLSQTYVVREELPEPGPGRLLLSISAFGMSSNNLTYALLGDQLGHWGSFPASAPGRGRVPAWGEATVVAADPDLAPLGSRWVGYLPMATHLSLRAERVGDRLRSVDPWRTGLDVLYRDLSPQEEVPERRSRHVAMLPYVPPATLFREHARAGRARRVVFTGATSKTALCCALLLREVGLRTVGVTAPSRSAAARQSGVYDDVVAYDELEALDQEVESWLVDVAGDPVLLNRVRVQLGKALVRTIGLGASHGVVDGPSEGPAVDDRFNTAAALAALRADLGYDGVDRLMDQAWRSVARWSVDAVAVDEVAGLDAAAAAWRDIVTGSTTTLRTPVIVPNP